MERPTGRTTLAPSGEAGSPCGARRGDPQRHWLHLQDLRHAFATFLLDQGEELRTVMELLGHSTIRMTADTYGHVLPARARQAASAIDRILGQEGRRDRLAVLKPSSTGKCWWSPGDSNP
ncbi:tyrosine-type recombinase/integrase [Micromonospora arida]|uniref:tyrosine-type recombinase/integrase n=1 Tax=Micromonospora arida TaxID=2203715 RepID=UPI0033BCBB3D